MMTPAPSVPTVRRSRTAWLVAAALLISTVAVSAFTSPRVGCLVAGLALLVAITTWRPHGWGPTLGAGAAVTSVALGGFIHVADLGTAISAQWRAFVTLASVMTMTVAAEQLGLLERLAALIEPRTRGPVRHAFRTTFVLSALVAAALSNDAAILVVTPTVLVLLRTVYPRRNPKFLEPFALAVFAAAGVAPLVVSNPMNLIFAEHLGIGFNEYAVRMIPVAVVGWLVAYGVLAWQFREVLADPAPALGHWPERAPLSVRAWLVLGVLVVALAAYPLAAAVDLPVWPVAATCALLAAGIHASAGLKVRALVGGVTWSIFPFLLGVFLLAMALERAGVVEALVALVSTSHPLVVIGATSAVGSAVLNNHPTSVLHAFALKRMSDPDHTLAFAALVGGDLGPRLLPVGSLASLLWYDLLQRHHVSVRVTTFVRVGVALTVPTLAASLATLWLLSH